ncbi:hypothetical protein [Chryseobacterium sp. CT-SW4]|uniref:hypothetical protein n=1 Tax=Chryseobacterium sp. SW-1 TaxID=3157343 RepID=UPI003B013B65
MKQLVCSITVLITSVMYGQVGINTTTPDKSSIVDMSTNNKGLLIPRLTQQEKIAIAEPANGLLVYDTDRQCLSQNIGTPVSPSWTCLGNNTRSFYMPSMVVDTQAGTGKTVDLYNIYKQQFEAPMAKSSNAPASIPYYSSPDDLYYYVSYYDNSVINITNISDSGVLTYDVVGTPSDFSYMNIVFVIK